MAKNVKQTKKSNMQSHIDAAYETINNYLPSKYLERVREKLSQDIVVSDGTIRNIRNKFNKPDGKIEVLNALVEVALDNKKAIQKLENQHN
jgi:hypothetical protein